jgi:hypothetical protein
MPVLKNKEEWAFLTGEERLDDWIRYHYGLDLVSVEPVGGVLKLETDQGFFVLKRVRMREKDRWHRLPGWLISCRGRKGCRLRCQSRSGRNEKKFLLMVTAIRMFSSRGWKERLRS